MDSEHLTVTNAYLEHLTPSDLALLSSRDPAPAARPKVGTTFARILITWTGYSALRRCSTPSFPAGSDRAAAQRLTVFSFRRASNGPRWNLTRLPMLPSGSGQEGVRRFLTSRSYAPDSCRSPDGASSWPNSSRRTPTSRAGRLSSSRDGNSATTLLRARPGSFCRAPRRCLRGRTPGNSASPRRLGSLLDRCVSRPHRSARLRTDRTGASATGRSIASTGEDAVVWSRQAAPPQ